MSIKLLNEMLRSWEALNEALKTADEELCQQLMKAELGGAQRKMFVLRIFSRYNRVRAARERQALKAKFNTA